MPCTIQPMRRDDIPAVTAVEQAAYQTAVPQREYLRELTDNPAAHYLTLWQDDQLIGVAGFWLLMDEAHITTIAVHPTQQRQRLGEWLLIHLLELAIEQGATVATLEVRLSNRVAQALYAKYQFAEVGRRANYYQHLEDALILTTPPLTTADYQAVLRRNRSQLQGS